MSDFYARRPGSWNWELESTLLFMMTSFLKSRSDAGRPSNAQFYDEDVNVYLAGLLASYVSPDFMDRAGKYISSFDIDVAQLARRVDDRSRFTIYKVNADHLMVSAGVFDAPTSALDEAPRNFARTIGRGQTYYQMAASYGRALARRDTGAVEVMEKLARGFPDYVEILHHLRSEYFNLIERLGQHDVAEIQTEMRAEAAREQRTQRVDALLDLYSTWQTTHDPALVESMRALVQQIQEDDPDFRFDLPSAP